MLKHRPPSRDSTSWPFKDAPPFSTCTRPTIRRLRGAAPKCIRTCSEQCFMPRDARNLETRAIHHQVPPKNGACWQLAVSDWLRINMEMEGWEKWEPVYQPFNGPRSKYPRRVAVDYELVYSINTASRATGNLMKVQDARTHTHTQRRSFTLGMLLRALRWQTHTHTHTEGPPHWVCAEGTQVAGRVTVSCCNPGIALLSHEAQGKKETTNATIVNIRQKTESISSMKQTRMLLKKRK